MVGQFSGSSFNRYLSISIMKIIFYSTAIFCLVILFQVSHAQVIGSVAPGTRGQVFKVTPKEGSIYIWSVTGGTIVADRDSLIIVDWGMEEGTFQIKTVEISKNGCLGETIDSNILLSKDA